jgi:protocatechuate 3,4-dioxygenase, alpha subunit
MTAPPIRLTHTASQTVGPFFAFALTADVRLGCLVTPATAGERMQLQVRVLDGDGAPITDAMVELYQADADGVYSPPADPPGAGFSGFGRLGTSDGGACLFETVRPGRVSDGRGGLQASHVNVCVFARGLLRHLHTRLYFEGDPAIDRDPILGLVPIERRHTLLARRSADRPGTWTFDVRLQGTDETVFFDL